MLRNKQGEKAGRDIKAFLTGETYVFNYSILHPSSRAILERD